MPPPPTLKIVEVFASIQGEGLRQGEPTIFIRLTGCDLRCSFCDTKYAWTGGRTADVPRILERVRSLRKRFPAAWACLTGGEPLLQDIAPLVRSLKKDGLKVQVETNGRTFRPLTADWLTVSPKPPRYACRPQLIKRAREVKLVVSRTLTLGTIARVRREFPRTAPLLLQPESNAAWSRAKARRLLDRAVRAGLENMRYSLQLHKILGLR